MAEISQAIGSLRQAMTMHLTHGKMILCLKDFALASLKRTRYRLGQAPSIIRRFDKQIKQKEQKQITDAKNSFWSI